MKIDSSGSRNCHGGMCDITEILKTLLEYLLKSKTNLYRHSARVKIYFNLIISRYSRLILHSSISRISIDEISRSFRENSKR